MRDGTQREVERAARLNLSSTRLAPFGSRRSRNSRCEDDTHLQALLAAATRVLIDFQSGAEAWTTVGASTNIIEASWRALADSMEYALIRLATVGAGGA